MSSSGTRKKYRHCLFIFLLKLHISPGFTGVCLRISRQTRKASVSIA
jgi:hypothetical protein